MDKSRNKMARRTLLSGLAALVVISGAHAAGPSPAGDWRAQEIGGSGVPDGLESTLSIAPDGLTTGIAGCNIMRGRATIEGEKLYFGPLTTTQMACRPAVDDQERKFLRALDETRLFVVEGSFLRLKSAEGKGLMTLIRVDR